MATNPKPQFERNVILELLNLGIETANAKSTDDPPLVKPATLRRYLAERDQYVQHVDLRETGETLTQFMRRMLTGLTPEEIKKVRLTSPVLEARDKAAAEAEAEAEARKRR